MRSWAMDSSLPRPGVVIHRGRPAAQLQRDEPSVASRRRLQAAIGGQDAGVERSRERQVRGVFILPYQRLLDEASFQGVDLAPLIAQTPAEHFDEFSYGSELVTQDGAIAALTELARVVDLLPDVVDGPWDRVAAWLADRLADAWHARGPYPGLGPLLTAAGLDRGPVLARRVLDDLPKGVTDPWPELDRAVTENRDGLVGRKARKAWEHLTADAARYRQLRVMSRFGLTTGQARNLFDGLEPESVLDNPYNLYESGLDPSLAFTTVDRGLWPQDADARAALAADPIDEPVTEAEDDRRVRAASVHVLERAAEQGHTLLDEAGLRKRLAHLQLEPMYDPVNADFEIAVRDFAPLIVKRELAREAARGRLRDCLAEVSVLIAAAVRARVQAPALDVSWHWADRIAAVLPTVEDPDVAEREARNQIPHVGQRMPAIETETTAGAGGVRRVAPCSSPLQHSRSCIARRFGAVTQETPGSRCSTRLPDSAPSVPGR